MKMKITIEVEKKRKKIYAVAKSNLPGDDEIFEQKHKRSGSKTVREEIQKLISAIEEDGTCSDMESS